MHLSLVQPDCPLRQCESEPYSFLASMILHLEKRFENVRQELWWHSRTIISDIDDRNVLLIYETAIVVGLPVTLISLVAWRWYGETSVAGR